MSQRSKAGGDIAVRQHYQASLGSLNLSLAIVIDGTRNPWPKAYRTVGRLRRMLLRNRYFSCPTSGMITPFSIA
jgi:hypothetical protein